MKQLLKDIIIDQKSFLPSKKTIIRSFSEKYLNNEEIIIISGVRRCGKSVLLQQIRDRLPQKDYFFNFDDDRLGNFTIENFQQLFEISLFSTVESKYFAKRLYNSGKKVFITGSNARMLSKELGTYLTGCYIAIELYPFSFSEFLNFREQQHLLGDISGTIARGEIQSAFNDYLKQGGFPIYLKSEDGIVLKTLYDNILYKDVMVRNQIVNEREVKELVYYTVSNIGKPLTYTSLAKVIGVKNPTTVKNYLEYIENTYLLFSLSIVPSKPSSVIPKKFMQ